MQKYQPQIQRQRPKQIVIGNDNVNGISFDARDGKLPTTPQTPFNTTNTISNQDNKPQCDELHDNSNHTDALVMNGFMVMNVQYMNHDGKAFIFLGKTAHFIDEISANIMEMTMNDGNMI